MEVYKGVFFRSVALKMYRNEVGIQGYLWTCGGEFYGVFGEEFGASIKRWDMSWVLGESLIPYDFWRRGFGGMVVSRFKEEFLECINILCLIDLHL